MCVPVSLWNFNFFFMRQNLDALHDHLGLLYPGMRAPSFRCTEEPDGSLMLHYYSDRPGLEYIVIGIVKVSRGTFVKESCCCNFKVISSLLQAVASKLHGVEVDIKIIKRKGDPLIVARDAENNCTPEDNITRLCGTNKHDSNRINNNGEIQVPEIRCEQSE
jgi:hypothetical protein